MGSCFSDMKEGKRAMYRDGYAYDDDFGSAFRPRYADTQLQLVPSAPALSILPEEEEEDKEADAQKEEEEERQLAIAIMVSLEPELQQGSISPLSFWQIESAADASSSSMPLQLGQARVQRLPSARQAQPNGSDSRPECEYCYDAPIGATCDPCGHVACFNCWVKIQKSDNKCPRCRVVIKKIIKLYL